MLGPNGGRGGLVEILLAALGLTLAAISYPLEWRSGEYAGVVVAAIALGMRLALWLAYRKRRL